MIMMKKKKSIKEKMTEKEDDYEEVGEEKKTFKEGDKEK
jgi:hypothetical protein